MADPLSVLGAAVGVTALIIQTTDECIKGCNIPNQGFKLYHEAANLPETYRYLQVRFQMEQQRFLDFSLEAGILYVDGVICGTLQISRHLLIAVLAEFRLLLERYADTNCKYEKLVASADVDRDDDKDLESNLMALLFLPPDDKITKGRENSTSKRAEYRKRVRKFGNTIAQAGRNLRTIAVEPKRLVWAAVDKDSFEGLISKLENLNSFLIALLDSSQLRRLQATMDTNYFVTLQLRNDVDSLKTLIKALTPRTENQQKPLRGKIGEEDNPLFRTVAEETATQERRKQYLKQLVEMKIQSTELSQLNSNATGTSDSNPIGTPLPRGEFIFAKGALGYDALRQRTSAVYRGVNVWIDPDTEQVGRRIGLLTDLLRFVKPDGFRAPPCLGYVKINDDTTRFGIVFEKLSIAGAQSDIVTLRELIGREPKPSLSTRISLCAIIARCVHSFHAVNWLHKALRADNIIFFSSAGILDLKAPFVSGFELARPSTIDQMTEKPRFDPLNDIYRHPSAQFSQADGNYRKSYDIYSLGVVIVEIALWNHVEDIVGLQDLRKAKPRALRDVRSWLLGKSALPTEPAKTGPCLQQVASACGDTVRNVVELCLEADSVEKPEYVGEQETAAALRLQKMTEQGIVKKLEYIAEML
ncbi:MAG: hypothetical protein Q9196_001338 [Gyalolechia fulgens]